MSLTKTLPIVHKTKTLFSLDFEYLDSRIFDLFTENSQNIPLTKKKHIKPLCLLLNAFLGLQNKNLTIIAFLNQQKTNQILSEFNSFLINNGFSKERNINVSYRNLLLKIIYNINSSFKTNISIDLNFTFNVKNIIDEQIRYFDGWWLNLDSEIYSLSIQLHQCFKKFGNNETEILFEKIKKVSIEQPGIFIQSVSVLNKFLNFLPLHSKSIFDWDEEFIIKSFLKDFFINKEKNGNDLHNAKIEWNYFNKLAQIIFNLSNDSLLIINVKRKQSFEHNIKKSKKGQIKVKLITDIPLELCDNKALVMLIQKINQDVNLVKDWANNTINLFLAQTKDKSKLLQSENYGLSNLNLSKKLKNKTSVLKENIFNKDTVFQKKHALAISYLLIAEHPEITESFLLNCDFNNSIKETDQGTYLISYKNRKGPNLAEQKILLNQTSFKLIEILLEETKILREYLKFNNNIDFKKLFICCNSSDLFPTAPKVLNEREGNNRDTNKSIIKFLTEERSFEDQSAIAFANKITLTKMRASRGVQIYLTTESTTKMAQALGHKRHRPELLAHYLPEPITDFFQRRWISIFQKGIICEALKNSEFFLKATGFYSMGQLDEFLNNHTLKKIPDNSDSILNKNKKMTSSINENSELYISVNEQNLTALLSINKAVNDAERKHLVVPNAHYWSLFTERLIKEIEENRSYSSFRQILVSAKAKIDTKLFKDIIYVE